MESIRKSMIRLAASHIHPLESIIIKMGKNNELIDVTEVGYAIGGDLLTMNVAHAKMARAYRIVAAHLLEHMSDGQRLVKHGVFEHQRKPEDGGPYFTLPEANNGA